MKKQALGILNMPVFFLLLGGLACFLVSAMNIYVFSKMRDSAETTNTLTEIIKDIIYLDEVLTMSSRMAAFQGLDPWEARYLEHAEKLDEAIAKAYELAPDAMNMEATAQTDAANQALIKKETQAFDYVRQDRLQDAQDILFSPTYAEQKSLYAAGMTALTTHLNAIRDQNQIKNKQLFMLALGLSILMIFMLYMSVYYSFRQLKRRRAQEKVVLRNEKLTHLGEISGNMAHEINNALTPIVSLSEIIAKRLKETDPKYASYMETLVQSAFHARDIVNNVLIFARGGETEQNLYDAKHVLTNAVKFSKHVLPASVILQVDESEAFKMLDNFTVRLNQPELIQVFSNLFSNAAHAMGNSGSVAILYDVKSLNDRGAAPLHVQAGEYITICVSDSGHGIAKKNLDKIFTPFFTTKKEGEGTGLGLPQIFGVMEKMGGTITVKSKQGEGTTFTLYFPNHRGEEA